MIYKYNYNKYKKNQINKQNQIKNGRFSLNYKKLKLQMLK